MTDKLSYGQLLDLADFERSGHRVEDNVDYIAYLWDIIQDYDDPKGLKQMQDIAMQLKKDYETYTKEIKS